MSLKAKKCLIDQITDKGMTTCIQCYFGMLISKRSGPILHFSHGC